LMVAVHIYAVRIGIKKRPSGHASPDSMPLSDLSIGQVLIRYGHLLLGLAVLTWLLMIQLPAGVAATYAIFVLIGFEAIKQLILSRCNIRTGLRHILVLTVRGFVEGAKGGAQMAIVIAVLGVMVEIFVATGFAQKLSILML